MRDLILKLIEGLGRRRDDYLNVANQYQPGTEFYVSFTARAAETDQFITDLEVLLELAAETTST